MSARFATLAVLRAHEVFDALEACAVAERALLQCGRPAEAAGVAALFELLEDRVTLDPGPATPDGMAFVSKRPDQLSVAGSNSRDRELTQ